MKKKLGFRLGIMFVMAAFIAALVSVVIINTKQDDKKERTYAAAFTQNGETVSARYGGDALFSAEKVLVTATPEEGKYNVGSRYFAYNRDGDKYYFEDYYSTNPTDKKEVIEDGTYVKLDNVVDAGNYFNKDSKTVGSGTKAQDAILITLGHYILDTTVKPETIETTQSGRIAGITKLQISATYNGSEIDSLKNLAARDIAETGGPYFDFAFLMTQKDFEEGEYTFYFEYLKNGEPHSAEFSFNLIFDSNYTKVIDEANGYQAQPVLGWTGDTSEFNKRNKENAAAKYVRYYDGFNGTLNKTTGITPDPSATKMNSISYPTITFDYMKYRMTYTHTYNRIETTYTYTTLGENGLELLITATNKNGTTTRRETMTHYKSNSTNLVTVLFTKPGEYTFSFDYLYKGEIPNGVEFNSELRDVKLYIHGLELKYSKVNYESATLRHFVLSANAEDKVDLVVANGARYNKENEAETTNLDLIYSIDKTSTERVGNVITSFEDEEGSRDSLVNSQLLTSYNNGGTENDYDYLLREVKNIANNAEGSGLDKVISKINYVKTNQGSFWFKYNDNIDETQSFYFYSASDPSLKVTIAKDENGNETNYRYNALFESLDAGSTWRPSYKEFSNQTSFNKIGYYLVFMKVEPLQEGSEYYEVFAFQYSADSVNIQAMEEGTTTPIGNYTLKNVDISWQDPDVFEKRLKGYYYIVNDRNVELEELLAQPANDLENGQTIGGTTVQDGHYAKILVKIENSSKSATYRLFTIDRADIENVVAYIVRKSTTPLGDVVYSIDSKPDGSKKVLTTGITDSYVSLNWQENNDGKKNSGANITAEYSYVPFALDESIQPNRNAEYGWIQTKYKLGQELGPFTNYIRPTSASQIRTSGYFFKQGIYRVVLTDEAGNSCIYSFVIDNTEAFYQVTNDGNTTFRSGENLIFATDTTYNVGTYKNIKLNFAAEDVEMKNLVTALHDNDISALQSMGYYMQDREYINNLSSLFKKDGSQLNLIVENFGVSAYDINGVEYTQFSGIGGTITTDIKGGATSAVVNLHLNSKNNECSSLPQGHDSGISYLTIEVNDDNSRGNVYFYNKDGVSYTNIPTDSKDSPDGTIVRLFTGSDEEDKDGNLIPTTGLDYAQATSAKHVTFTWNMGNGNTAVTEVSYKRHELTTNFDEDEAGGKYFFYKPDATVEYIFESNTFKNGAESSPDGKVGYFSFDIGGNKTSEGLYVVTRTYANGEKKNYYFIVDRSSIIDSTQGNIYIRLLEETSFADFVEEDDGFVISHMSSVGERIERDFNYSVYLTTNKVPAVLSVPVGKIIIGNNFSNYQAAGRLTATLYYSGASGYCTIYKGKIEDYDYSGDAFYSFDIASYLNANNKELYKEFIKVTDNGNWIYKPGIYCLVIEDNVLNITTYGKTNNKKIIGFEIEQEDYPEIDIESGYQMSNLDENTSLKFDNNGTFNLSTNEEYVQFKLPAYVDGATYAQVDPGFVDIKVSVIGKDGTIKASDLTYLKMLNNAITDGSGTFKDRLNNEIKKCDRTGLTTINLNTRFEVDGESYSQTDKIIYTIEIRFKVSGNDKFAECYIVGEKTYYKSIYNIVIDREAPNVNVEALVEKDAEFINYYNEEYGVESLFADGEHKTNAENFYTKEYAAYYQDAANKKMSKIYAFNVYPDTKLVIEDNSRLRYRLLDAKSRNISLPILNENEYSLAVGLDKETTFEVLFEDSYNLYEIIEIDEAGNVTQYVVNYTNNFAYMELTFGATSIKKDEFNTVTLRSDIEQEPISLFAIDKGAENYYNSKFFRIELIDSLGRVSYKNTNLLTSLTSSEVSDFFAKKINAKGMGNYILRIINPYTDEGLKTTSYNISLYEKDTNVRLDIDSLIVNSGSNYYINLTGANKTVKGAWYYAETIKINNVTYKVSKIDNAEPEAQKAFVYVNQDTNEEIVGNIVTLTAGTYKITMTDILENVYSRRISTTGENDFYSVSTEEGYGLVKEGDIYYAFNKVTVKYAADSFEDVKVTYRVDQLGAEMLELTSKVDGLDIVGQDYVICENGKITILPIAGHAIEVRVLYDTDEYDIIVIEGRIGEVELVEYLTGNKQDIVNTWNNNNIKEGTSDYATGRMTLLLNKDKTTNFNDAYVFNYVLYQEGKEGKVLKNEYATIVTERDESERYLLVIEVYSKDGTYLGQVNNEFYVKATHADLFAVYLYDLDELGNKINNRTMEPNSTFRSNDISGVTIPSELTDISLPLYVINSTNNYEIIKDVSSELKFGDHGENNSEYQVYMPMGDLYELRLYILDAGTYRVGFGVLIVQNTEELVSDLVISYGEKLAKTMKITSEDKSVVVATEIANNIQLSGKRTQTAIGNILQKNLLKVNIYFEEQLVNTITFNELTASGEFSFTILGNGEYTFVIYDLAGNVQKFDNIIEIDGQDLVTKENQTGELLNKEVCGIEIIPLREVVVKVKTTSEEEEYVPLDNAYYSEQLELRVYSSYLYKNGSISVTALRNGEPYSFESTAPYLFADYGTYKVTIKAIYEIDEKKSLELTKTIAFTILNSKEARKSMDMASINGCKITKVLNNFEQDVTGDFVSKVLAGGSYVSYDKIKEFAKELQTTHGKNQFTIFYEYDDGIYPKRELSFAFTLNDEIPEIECSIEKGEKTNKGFDITFNAGIIYEQIGEAAIYINDRLVAEINAESPYDIQKVSTTFKEHGAGDYYVQLITSSGNVITSYKVTITEPLNVWAIIIIIVAVVVVGTVTTVIIVLRHKMKIR